MVRTTKIMIIWWKKKSWQEVKFGREGKGGERQKAVGDLRAAAVTSSKRQRAAPGWPSGHWANVANVVEIQEAFFRASRRPKTALHKLHSSLAPC